MTDTIVASGVSLNDLVGLEEAHCQVPRQDSRCTQIVRWSMPPSPRCRCFPRLLSCQGTYDYVMNTRYEEFECELCGVVYLVSEARKGWYPV